MFQNQPPPDPSYIDNCDGEQGGWLFAQQEVGLFQDYDTIGGESTVPSHDFDAQFNVGSSYSLTVGVIGGGGGMLPGATFELGLYYRDAASNRITIASTTVTNSLSQFSNTTHFVDFNVGLPVVRSSDAWAGQHIGIHLLSTVTTNFAGGYWDVDDVRLEEFMAPILTDAEWANGQFSFTLIGEPGREVEILASTNVEESFSNWTSLGFVTNVTGTSEYHDLGEGGTRRFYAARYSP